MSTCNSVNLVKGNGLKTVLSFCNNTWKVLRNNVVIISLNSVLDFYGRQPLLTNGLGVKTFPCSSSSEDLEEGRINEGCCLTALVQSDPLFDTSKKGCISESSARNSYYLPHVVLYAWALRH